jgi:hypothetical protein
VGVAFTAAVTLSLTMMLSGAISYFWIALAAKIKLRHYPVFEIWA